MAFIEEIRAISNPITETKKMLVVDLLAHFEEGMSHNLKYDWERAKKEIQSNGLMRYFTFFVALLITSILFSSTQLLELRYQEITVGGWLYFISLFALIVISIVCVIKYIVRLLAVFQDKYLFGRNKFTAMQIVSDIFGIAYRRKIELKESTKTWNLCIFLLLGLGIIPAILIVSAAVILIAYGLFPTSIVSGLIEIINLGSKMQSFALGMEVAKGSEESLANKKETTSSLAVSVLKFECYYLFRKLLDEFIGQNSLDFAFFKIFYIFHPLLRPILFLHRSWLVFVHGIFSDCSMRSSLERSPFLKPQRNLCVQQRRR